MQLHDKKIDPFKCPYETKAKGFTETKRSTLLSLRESIEE